MIWNALQVYVDMYFLRTKPNVYHWNSCYYVILSNTDICVFALEHEIGKKSRKNKWDLWISEHKKRDLFILNVFMKAWIWVIYEGQLFSVYRCHIFQAKVCKRYIFPLKTAHFLLPEKRSNNFLYQLDQRNSIVIFFTPSFRIYVSIELIDWTHAHIMHLIFQIVHLSISFDFPSFFACIHIGRKKIEWKIIKIAYFRFFFSARIV